jgi:acyl-coenzyme A synthetase/AMP-(fatty) acid ligase
MFIDFLIDVFRTNPGKDALLWHGKAYSYSWLLKRVEHWQALVASKDIKSGDTIAIEGDFSPESTALLLALIERGAIIVPHMRANEAEKDFRYDTAGVQCAVSIDVKDKPSFQKFKRSKRQKLYGVLIKRRHPGLVLFTSGSSGQPKAAVHDFVGLLEKFKTPRTALRTLQFLLFDHWGGLNTLLHTLANAGAVATVSDRNPEVVCAAIAKHGIEVLPCSPTFLNLLLLSEAYRGKNLRSLKIISYGTEPMPPLTLARLHKTFPAVKLHQTYGLIELGVLRSKSRSDDSLWVKIGGEGFETRVIDGLLQIKARSAMLGYLNAPSPFTKDGWFMTGDSVEMDGEFFRILGRKSELINVGGDKVYPQEVENVISACKNVAEVTVYGEKNPFTGSFVCAKIRPARAEKVDSLIARVKNHCRKHLPPFKVPVRIIISEEKQHGHRFKKKRV